MFSGSFNNLCFEKSSGSCGFASHASREGGLSPDAFGDLLGPSPPGEANFDPFSSAFCTDGDSVS
jgi:hypothetical protein